MTSKIIASAAILFVLNGCAPMGGEPEPRKLKDVSYSVTEEGETVLTKRYEPEDEGGEARVEKEVKSGTIERIPDFEAGAVAASEAKQAKKPKPLVVYGKEKVQVAVEAIPMHEFIDLLFSQVLKLNYTVTDEVRAMKAPVTLNMSAKQSKQQVFEVVKKLLQMNGVAITKESGVFFLSRQSEVSAEQGGGKYIGYGRSVPKRISGKEQIGLFVPRRRSTSSART